MFQSRNFSALQWFLAVLALSMIHAPIHAQTSLPPVAHRFLDRAHAHNDYQHPHPLLDALQLGFHCVEVDIWLVKGQILVAHDQKELRPDRNLEKMYLQPLQKRFESNGGWIYSTQKSLILLIDIKSNGDEMYPVLKQLLQKYSAMLKPSPPHGQAAVQAILSGNRPIKLVQQDLESLVAIDGRLVDLKTKADSKTPPTLIPLVSDNWRNHFLWNGEGEFPPEEKEKLTTIVNQAHSQGRQLRFWATPENERLWEVLYEQGVDLIGTDELDKLAQFLRKKKEASTR